LPIDNADKLTPMTLVALLTRMKSLPSAEKKLLVICHGSNEGLGIPLTQGSTNRATRDVLHILLVLGNATKRAQEISALPSTAQQAEWQKLLNGMKYVDGTQMFPTIDGDSAAACQRFFNYFLDRTTGQKSKFPEGDDVQVLPSPRSKFKIQFSRSGPTTSELQPTATASDVQSALEAPNMGIGKGNIIVTGPAGGPWTCVFVGAQGGKAQPDLFVNGNGSNHKGRVTEAMFAGVQTLSGVASRQDLTNLLSLCNDVRGRFDRIDFRSCNTGRNKPALEKVREFFGCKQVCAPDVVSFSFNMPVTLSPDFDKKLEKNIDDETNKKIKAGRAPVKLDPGTQFDVTIPVRDMPKTRRFDSDKTRSGDEVFIRIWAIRIHPTGQGFGHQFGGFLDAIAVNHVEQFAKDKIDPDISLWKTRTTVPMFGLWLIDDSNQPISGPSISPAPTGDPLAGLNDDIFTSSPASSLPAFALPRDPEYIKHLVCVP
jgi:hypothetical protein